MTGRISFCANQPVGTYPPQAQNVPEKNYSSVGFKGYDYDYYDKPKKKTSPLLVVGGLLASAAAIIGGLGYAHKTNALSKLNDGKIKDILKKAEPAAKKCHEWCSAAKTKCMELVNKFKKDGKN